MLCQMQSDLCPCTTSCCAHLQVSAEEWREIMSGLLKGNADLRNEGYTGHGHFFKCPKGHPYVIGDCGGATETSRCPHCGSQIGGTQHQVLGGNSQHEGMAQMARDLQLQR